MSDEGNGSFLTSVISAASSTASTIATNLSDRLKDEPLESNRGGEETLDKAQLHNADGPKGSSGEKNMNPNKRNSGRLHSHTISGDRPLLTITNPRLSSSSHRRNSDGGSPGLTLPMLGDTLLPAAPTATTATSETAIFSSTAPSLSLEHLDFKSSKPSSDTGSVHSVQSDSAVVNNDQKIPIADPETSVAKEMLVVPRRKPRPRGSSVSIATFTDAKGTPLSRSNSGASRKGAARRKDSDDTDVDNGSEGAYSAAAGSIASACGMELASAKRNSDYHALFRSVPEEDVLIEDYGCALQKEILVQGRMYISETHVCFNANIFGWVTNLVIAFTEIVAIEKRMTAKFIPNAIQISTLHSKHLFASFLSRDQAYDQLVDIWHVAHPNLSSRTLKAKVADSDDDDANADNDKDESGSETDETDEYGSDYDSDDYTEVSEEEEEEAATDDQQRTDRQSSVHTLPLPPHKAETDHESRRRAMSDLTTVRASPKDLSKSSNGNKPSYGDSGNEKQASSANDSGADKVNGSQPGKVVKHAPTQCACEKNGEHYSNVALDEIYTGTLETINNLLYNSGFTKKFLVEKEKSTDVNIGNWEKGQGDVQLSRETNYIKYLGGSIGPKTTKCILKDEVLHFDFDDYITQVTTTQTPDVPSGSSFCVKTRTCLTWAGDNKVRMLVTFSVEFSKSSWLKSTIEKASADGQVAYFKSLDESVRKYIHLHPNEFHAAGGKHPEAGEKKKRRRRRRREQTKEQVNVAGLTEPEKRGLVQKILSPFAFIGGILWSGIKFVIEHAQIPTAQHITVVFMLMMLLVSLFAAKKMADMERRLEILATEMQVFPSQGMWISDNEREQVWQWLLAKDSQGVTHQERGHTPLSSEAANHATRSHTATVHSNKQDLDYEISQLGMQVQEARKKLEQLTLA